MAKRAILVLGSESSGTRMMTKAIVRSGFWGQAEHSQLMDNLEFNGRADNIVFRRSLPHSHHWPDINNIIARMEGAGYDVIVVCMHRKPEFTAQSQVVQGHVGNLEEAHANIAEAEYRMETIKNALHIQYEEFVTNDVYRNHVYHILSLPEKPDMVFYNANEKYIK